LYSSWGSTSGACGSQQSGALAQPSGHDVADGSTGGQNNAAASLPCARGGEQIQKRVGEVGPETAAEAGGVKQKRAAVGATCDPAQAWRER